jgi:hypothetical protein
MVGHGTAAGRLGRRRPREPAGGRRPLHPLLGARDHRQRHPQVALVGARHPFAITHAPGHMLITDVPDEAYAI